MHRLIPFVVLLSLGCAPEQSVLGRPYELVSSPGAEKELPLLILAHGYSASGPLQDFLFPFSKLQESRAFHYARLNGTLDRVGKRFWNASDFCCNFEDVPVDDVAYFRAVIEDVKAQRAVKPGHVFVVGHSNGAFMALRLACEASDVVDGIVAVSGSTWTDFSRCPDGRAIPILFVHGTVDGTILYEGEEGKYPSVFETSSRFATRSGCRSVSFLDQGETRDFVEPVDQETKIERSLCPTPFEIWKLEGIGHVPAFNAAWTAATFDWLEARASP